MARQKNLTHKWGGEKQLPHEMGRQKKRGSPQHVISWGEAERLNSSNLDVRLRHEMAREKNLAFPPIRVFFSSAPAEQRE